MTPALKVRRAAAAGTRRSAAAPRPAVQAGAPGVRSRGQAAPAVRPQRRISGPAPRGDLAERALRPALRPLPVIGTIGSHALRAGRSLHDSSLLDRLMRGRAWIGLLGVLLIGLVGVNVSLLKLNAQAGRNAQAARELRIENTALASRTARLGSADRIEAAGRKLGLVMASPGNINYLTSRAVDGRLAASKITEGVPPTTTETTTATTAPVVPADPAEQVAAADPQAAVPQPQPDSVATETPETAPAAGAPPTGGGAVPPPATIAPGTG